MLTENFKLALKAKRAARSYRSIDPTLLFRYTGDNPSCVFMCSKYFENTALEKFSY